MRLTASAQHTEQLLSTLLSSSTVIVEHHHQLIHDKHIVGIAKSMLSRASIVKLLVRHETESLIKRSTPARGGDQGGLVETLCKGEIKCSLRKACTR